MKNKTPNLSNTMLSKNLLEKGTKISELGMFELTLPTGYKYFEHKNNIFVICFEDGDFCYKTTDYSVEDVNFSTLANIKSSEKLYFKRKYDDLVESGLSPKDSLFKILECYNEITV